MTPQSVALAYGVSLCVALACGFAMRRMAWGSAWSLAMAVAVGIALLRATGTADIGNALWPRDALDWLPIASIMSAIVVSILPHASRSTRWGIAAAVGGAIAIRMLWGSIYLRSLGSLMADPQVAAAVLVWAIALAVGLAHWQPIPERRVSWDIAVWALSTAVTALVIAMSGSVVYGAAVGCVGVAMLGTLVGSSRLPLVAAVPLIILIGLAAAFAELTLGNAVILIGSLLVLQRVAAESIFPEKLVPAMRITAALLLIISAVATWRSFADELKRDDGGYGGEAAAYGNGAKNSVPPISPKTPIDSGQTEKEEVSPPTATIDSGGMPDPFGP